MLVNDRDFESSGLTVAVLERELLLPCENDFDSDCVRDKERVAVASREFDNVLLDDVE